MQLVMGTSEEEKGQMIGYWVGQMIKKPMFPPYTALGWLDRKSSLVGAAIFNSYNGANVEVTIYGPKAMTRQALQEGLRYVFKQLQCTRLTGRCSRNNSRMRKLFPRVGFHFEGTMPRYFGPERKDDALVFRMMPEQAKKWI